MQYYKEIELEFTAANPGLVSELLWELDPLGIEDILENKIKIYFPGDFETSLLTAALEKFVREEIIVSYNISEALLENRNWNEEWEKTINVNKVSDRFVIKPSFREYTPAPGEIVLTIDPKMSFGTGEHQTTRLMILALEKYCKPNNFVLDIGTGTGVLAIVAAKLGASKAIAFDNDDWCYENGIENCQLNNTGNLVEIRTAELSAIPETNFDLVIANIQRNPLLELAPEIVAKAKSGGTILLSGLLIEDEDIILEKYEPLGVQKLEKQTMLEWISLAFKKL
jgi:ribosomal protein L11 methyltransferase